MKDRVEHAREASLEVLAPQRVQAGGAVLTLLDHAGLAQDPEVMGAGDLVTGTSKLPQVWASTGLGGGQARRS